MDLQQETGDVFTQIEDGTPREWVFVTYVREALHCQSLWPRT